MNTDKIAPALTAALEHGHEIETPDSMLYPGMAPQKRFNALHDYRKPLVLALRAESDLAIFDDEMMLFHSISRRVTLDMLADWLVNRSHNVGVETAIADLSSYVNGTALTGTAVYALVGVSVHGDIELEGGIRLVRFRDIPQSFGQAYFSRPQIEFVSRAPSPLAALTGRITLPKRHGFSEGAGPFQDPSDTQAEVEAARMAIALAVPSAPTVVAYWVTLDPSIPLDYVESSITAPGDTELPRSIVRLEHDIGPTVRAIQKRLRAVSPSTVTALRVAVSRRHQAMCRANAVDAAIDVGIAFESLFLSDLGGDDRGEMAFRIQMRAARFLGSTSGERVAIRNLVRTAYRMRSTAAHTGLLTESFDKQPVETLFNESYALLGRAIVKILENDKIPDWNAIVLD